MKQIHAGRGDCSRIHVIGPRGESTLANQGHLIPSPVSRYSSAWLSPVGLAASHLAQIRPVAVAEEKPLPPCAKWRWTRFYLKSSQPPMLFR